MLLSARLNRFSTQSHRKLALRKFCGKILTDVDIEKELFTIKRRMGSLHSIGNYKAALECAEQLESRVKEVMGTQNSVYASCLNNVALMQKAMGQIDKSVDNYTQALHTYEEAVGKKHSSYAITLSNLGASYKAYAEVTKGVEKMELLQRYLKLSN